MEAFSFAACIVQFVQFSHFLLSGTREILGSAAGLQARFARSEDIAGLTQAYISILFRSIEGKWTGPPGAKGGLSGHEDDEERDMFRELYECSHVVSEELLSLIAPLKRSDKSQKFKTWDAFCRVIRGELSKERIKALDKHLARMSSLLNMHGTGVILRRLDSLRQENERLQATRSKDIELLRADVEKAMGHSSNKRQDRDQLPEIIRACQTYSAEQEILNRLKFDTISERFLGISGAHSKTFEWIFADASDRETSESTNEEHPRLNFSQWLESDQPVYWISGKPGSGKSTLMKYILGQQATSKHLQKWANGDQIDIVSFFFWAAAKDKLQKSQEGLLRAILYNLLRKRPNEIQHTFPILWKQYQPVFRLSDDGNNNDDDNDNDVDEDDDDDYPSVGTFSAKENTNQLLQALSRILRSSNDSKHKLFFLLDGLDEYDGEPGEIIELLKLMKVSVNTKFCLASRSWNEFEDAYGRQSPWKLYMQDLTRGDIALFVQDKLQSNEKFRALRKYDDRCPDLVREVVTSAEGVFLWVSLVVMSLLDGLTNDDRIDDLQKRLRQLPTELNKLFDHILTTISPFYRESAAHLLLVTLFTTDTLTLMTYWHIDQGGVSSSGDPRSDDQVQYQLQRMRGRLNTLSKGLLQVSPDPSPDHPVLWQGDRNVDFLHRTVVEYLNAPHIQYQLHSWVNKRFNAHVAICKGLLAHVAMIPRRQDASFEHALRSLLQAFYWNVEAMESDNNLEVEEIHYMNAMNKVLRQIERRFKHTRLKVDILPDIINSPYPAGVELIAVALNLVKYLRTVSDLHRGVSTTGLALVLLHLASLKLRRNDEVFLRKYAETLKILLEQGGLPNDSSVNKDYSIWATWLSETRSHKSRTLGGKSHSLRIALITLLLYFGADPQAKCLPKHRIDKPCNARHHLKQILTSSEYAKLQYLIEPRSRTKYARSEDWLPKERWRSSDVRFLKRGETNY